MWKEVKSTESTFKNSPFLAHGVNACKIWNNLLYCRYLIDQKLIDPVIVHNVVQKDDLRLNSAVVTNTTSLSESIKNAAVSVDHETYTADREQDHATGRPPGEWNTQQRVVSSRLDRPRLSPNSVGSCSSGDFIQPAQHLAPPVYKAPTSEQDSLADHGWTLSRSELQSMSREQVLRLLSQQQDQLSRRQTELLNLNSGILLTQLLTDADINKNVVYSSHDHRQQGPC